MSNWLIYGANGYTGGLVARLAAERGLHPILAGRNATQVIVEANGLGFSHRTFTLESPAALDQALQGVEVVLHCAGPFVQTALPVVEACVRRRIHYVDITGEIQVFEALAARDREFEQAGILVLPGAGFDVVPTDCLAAHLARRLPGAVRLELAFMGLGGVSRGTASTAIEGMASGAMGMVRRNGALTPMAPAHKVRQVDFGRGPRDVVSIPWGDVSTAWYSTGIPNIEVYMAAKPKMVSAMRAGRWFGPLLRLPFAKDLLKYGIHARAAGPSDEQRAAGRSLVWGRVEDAAGRSAEARLSTLEAYTLTAHSALNAVERILAGKAKPGFQTPSLAFGPDWVLDIPTTTREDL
ncbi:MAG: saccharopine dehydrogenase family protein [Caldilineaceae bacterium]